MIQFPSIEDRNDASVAYSTELAKYESHYAIHFSHYAYYSGALLYSLHKQVRSNDSNASIHIASAKTPKLCSQFKLLSGVANLRAAPDTDLRSAYFDRLRDVYAQLEQTPELYMESDDAGFVAPGRAGRILARAMAWAPTNNFMFPGVKRIPYRGGLLIGMTQLDTDRKYKRIELIDGAIASGATLMALMERLCVRTKIFDIYCVHAAEEGLRALASYARTRELQLSVYVGHVTAGLNKKFYATDAAGSRLVVGDLGDMIAGVPEVDGL